uniref:Steroid 5-alpha reductase C-terminal domain-containing protein n=1 Tax=Pavo cristatus TaxID=9049 RepID=A0A8C9G0H4_PAVCR
MAGGGGVFCAFWQWAMGPREQRLLELLSYGLVALGVVSALLLRFIPMPYGRYSSRRFGWLLPARPSWLLQELPALLVPIALASCIPAWRLPNAVLLSCFILHYVHRCDWLVVQGRACKHSLAFLVWSFFVCSFNPPRKAIGISCPNGTAAVDLSFL